MKTKVFTGEYFAGRVKRTVSSADPLNPTRMITATTNLDMVKNLVLSNVSGFGEEAKGTGFGRTGEDYITLTGKFTDGKLTRITVIGANVKPVADALLHENVDKTNPDHPLTIEHVVTAIGTPMPGGAVLVKELYLVAADGSTKAIIAAPEQAAAQSAELAFL